MKLKNIFGGLINIFKSKKEEKINENHNYKLNTNIGEKTEFNFEKLKKINEHPEIYNNENNQNIIKNNNEYTLKDNIRQSIQKEIITEKMENTLSLKNQTEKINTVKTITIEELKNEINTIWDIIKIKENTQAEHIIKSMPPDKWITMDELRQNIKLNFNIEYTNEKSLYPYLKTLVDINLIRMNNVGKKRTWKKNIIIIENKK